MPMNSYITDVSGGGLSTIRSDIKYLNDLNGKTYFIFVIFTLSISLVKPITRVCNSNKPDCVINPPCFKLCLFYIFVTHKRYRYRIQIPIVYRHVDKWAY